VGHAKRLCLLQGPIQGVWGETPKGTYGHNSKYGGTKLRNPTDENGMGVPLGKKGVKLAPKTYMESHPLAAGTCIHPNFKAANGGHHKNKDKRHSNSGRGLLLNGQGRCFSRGDL